MEDKCEGLSLLHVNTQQYERNIAMDEFDDLPTSLYMRDAQMEVSSLNYVPETACERVHSAAVFFDPVYCAVQLYGLCIHTETSRLDQLPLQSPTRDTNLNVICVIILFSFFC